MKYFLEAKSLNLMTVRVFNTKWLPFLEMYVESGDQAPSFAAFQPFLINQYLS